MSAAKHKALNHQHPRFSGALEERHPWLVLLVQGNLASCTVSSDQRSRHVLAEGIDNHGREDDPKPGWMKLVGTERERCGDANKRADIQSQK